MLTSVKVSIVVLTYNRRESLRRQMESLANIRTYPIEIVVVDNCSDESMEDIVGSDNRACLIRNPSNKGAVGRNSGIAASKGEFVVTLDDDVWGITDSNIEQLLDLFQQSDLAAVNFKILEDGTGILANWCHPYDKGAYADSALETYHISEGAVALRRSAIEAVGLYPDYFFISHEGPDLALRLINAGWRVMYCPDIVVTHAYEQQGRVSWRRYYFDTRNLMWLVLRNHSFLYGFKKLAIGWGAMLVYSIRDGYLRYWFKAVWDALRGAPTALRDRVPPSAAAKRRWLEIEQHKPKSWTLARRRIMRRGVKI